MKKYSFLVIAFLFGLTLNTLQAQNMHSKEHMHKNNMKKEQVKIIELSQDLDVYNTTSLELEPGQYIFKVTNNSVDKALGFYLTDTGAKPAQIENSGLAALVNKGETSQTGIVTLTPGNYQYSCPLNPTPHYSLVVK